MLRPIYDQLDIIHVECGMHMKILDVDPQTENFLCGCDICHLQLIIQRFTLQKPEPAPEVTPKLEPEETEQPQEPEPITAASDPKTDYVPKKKLRKPE